MRESGRGANRRCIGGCGVVLPVSSKKAGQFAASCVNGGSRYCSAPSWCRFHLKFDIRFSTSAIFNGHLLSWLRLALLFFFNTESAFFTIAWSNSRWYLSRSNGSPPPMGQSFTRILPRLQRVSRLAHFCSRSAEFPTNRN